MKERSGKTRDSLDEQWDCHIINKLFRRKSMQT